MAKEEKIRKANLNFHRLPMLGESTGEDIRCTECVNLRRVTNGCALESAGIPKAACGEETVVTDAPFAVVDNTARGRIALACRGVVLQALYLDEEAAEDVGVLPGRVTEALEITAGRIHILAGGVRKEVSVDDAGKVRMATVAPCTVPELHFEADVVGQVSETVTERALRGSYTSQSTRLTDADADLLAGDVLSAYGRLCRRAGLIGCFVQPVVARYRLEGAGGAVLYRSAPVVVCPGGFGLTGEKTLRLGASLTMRESGTMTADVWRLKLKSGSSVGAVEGIERLVVEMSRQIHPVDFGGYAANALDAGASVPALRFMMPGTSNGMAGSSGLALSRLRAVADRCMEAMEDVAVVSNPFASEGWLDLTIQPGRLAIDAAEDDAKALDAIGKSGVEKAGEMLASMMAPHRWEAHCGVHVGDTQVWGDIEVTSASPWPLEMLALSTAATGTWHGVVAVEMSDGEVLVRNSSGTGNVPTSLTPLLYYPHPGAKAVTIAIESGGVVRRGRYLLTPAADGKGAFWIPDNPVGWLPAAGGTMPTTLVHTGTTRRYASLLVSTTAGYSSDPVSAVGTAGGVKALATMDRRGGAWDYTRRRFYVFGASGTTLATLATNGSIATLHAYDARPVASASAVAVTTDDRYPLIVVAGSDVVGIGRSGIRTLVRGTGEGALAGWDSVDGELWIVDSAGRPTVRQGLEGGAYTPGGLTVGSMFTTSQGLFVCDGGRLLSTRAGRETAAETVYRAVVKMPQSNVPGLPRPIAASVDMASDDQLSGSITLGAFRWAIEGRVVRGRLVFRTLSPRMASLPVALAMAPATVFELRGLGITCGTVPTVGR